MENLSIEKALIEINSIKDILDNNTASKSGISSIYQILRNKLCNNMHNKWKKRLLPIKMGSEWYCSVK